MDRNEALFLSVAVVAFFGFLSVFAIYGDKDLKEENIRLSKIIHEQQVSIGEYKANEGNPNMVK